MSGEALPVLVMFTTPLDIANGSYSCIFLVIQDLPYDALLGRDFLRENGAIINLKESTLQLDGKRDEPYPERELARGLTCDQSPVQPTRHEEFTEERSATKRNPIKKRASQKHALHSAFIGTLFSPSTSGEIACVAWRFCRAGRRSGVAARKIKTACPDSWPFQLPPPSTHFDILLTTCLVSVFPANQKYSVDSLNTTQKLVI